MSQSPAPPVSFATIIGGGKKNGLLVTLVVDIALPWLTVQVLARLGVVGVPAFAAAALFPLGSILLSWARHRRVEFIGIAVVITMTLGVLMSVASDDVRFSVMKAAPAYGLFGVICLASLATARPLMFYVARYFTAGADAAKQAEWDARLARPGFVRAMRLLTLVWGVGTLAEAALGIACAMLLPPATALVAEPLIALGAVAALLTWTAAFARRNAPKET